MILGHAAGAAASLAVDKTLIHRYYLQILFANCSVISLKRVVSSLLLACFRVLDRRSRALADPRRRTRGG